MGMYLFGETRVTAMFYSITISIDLYIHGLIYVHVYIFRLTFPYMPIPLKIGM